MKTRGFWRWSIAAWIILGIGALGLGAAELLTGSLRGEHVMLLGFELSACILGLVIAITQMRKRPNGGPLPPDFKGPTS